DSKVEPPSAKNLLVVNTGYYKKKFIFARLKELGYRIYCLNSEVNWAKDYVTDWVISDNYNHVQAVSDTVSFIRKKLIKLDGVITFWEDDVLLTAKLVDALGLKGSSFTIASRARNKLFFREFCKANNLPTPAHLQISSKEDLLKIKENLEFPIVLKPAYGTLTALVIKVECLSELEMLYSYMVKNLSTQTETALHDGLDIFAEEYIDGDEVDIDLVLQNGKVKVAIVSDNYDKSRGKFFLDKGQATPSNLPPTHQKELIEMAEQVLEKMGITDGCIHFEAKYSKSGPVPLEINLRMGGDYIYSYILAVWGIDLIKLAASVACGEYIDSTRELKPKKYIIGWDFSTEQSGILNEVSIHPKLKKKPYFEDMLLYKELGDAVLVPPEGVETIGWITVSGENPLDVNDNLQEALEQVQLKVTKFDYQSFAGKAQKNNFLSSARIAKKYLLQKEKVNYVSSTELKKLDIALVTNIDQYQESDYNNYYVKVKDGLIKKGFKIEEILSESSYVILTKLRQFDYDYIINLINIELGNSKPSFHNLQAIEISGIPFTGATSFIARQLLDKIQIRKLLDFHDVPLPDWDYLFELEDEIKEELIYPLIVKPATHDFKIGINNESLITKPEKLRPQIQKMMHYYNCPVVVEEFLEGDEYEVIVIGNDDNDLEALPLNKLVFQKNKSKLSLGGIGTIADYIKSSYPAKDINPKLEKLLIELSFDIFTILDCRDYARFDFRLDEDGNPSLIDVNVSPFIQYTTPKFDYAKLYEQILQKSVNNYRKQAVTMGKPRNE
ncbi:hypothetical protein COW99_05145, partial [Candidatus Roizmanbacteria bacterium CG22_combo_CG10-13_8_21_14_all_38_20]